MFIVPDEKIQILVVDDNESFTNILCAYLKMFNNMGFEVIGVARNGLEAIDMITSRQPDLVILDIVMPDLDGISVLENINAMNLEKKPVFIMLTASGEDNTIQKAFNLGVAHYIEKPFDMNLLVSMIVKLKPTIFANS